MKLPANRRVGNDIIAGPFFIAVEDGDSYGSLPGDMINKYTALFSEPDSFTDEELKQVSTVYGVEMW